MMAVTGAGLPAPLNFFVARQRFHRNRLPGPNTVGEPLPCIRLRASFRGKLPGRQDTPGVRPFACEPESWNRAPPLPRSLPGPSVRCLWLPGSLWLPSIRNRRSSARRSARSGDCSCARGGLACPHPPDDQQAGQLPHAQHDFQHGHQPAPGHRRDHGSQMD